MNEVYLIAQQVQKQSFYNRVFQAGSRTKSWNTVKNCKYFERENFGQETGNTRTATLFCFGQLLFKGMFSCTVSDRCVLLMSRLTGGFSKAPHYQQYLAYKRFHT